MGCSREGNPYSRIAETLGVSYKTVVNTCSQLKQKLNARNLPDLIRIAVQLAPVGLKARRALPKLPGPIWQNIPETTRRNHWTIPPKQEPSSGRAYAWAGYWNWRSVGAVVRADLVRSHTLRRCCLKSRSSRPRRSAPASTATRFRRWLSRLRRRISRAPAVPNITDTLFQNIPGVSTSDQQGNSFQTDIRYRGFVASPVPGQPQGLAVYMNGMRINEAFGDTVNFDFIPTNAVDRADIQSNNPVFGLNALGGAINFQMKNGFNFHGFEGEFLLGSYGRISTGMQYGIQKDDVAAYIAVQGMNETGWRPQSPSELARVYADIGWRHDGNEVHVTFGAASNSFGVVAATPIELLQQNWSSIYTWPQTTLNQNIFGSVNGKYMVTDNWTLQGNFYARSFKQAHVDGNGADVERCSNASSFPNRLCLEDDGFPRPTPVTAAFRNQFVILDQNNNPIPCPPGAGNTCAPVPYGTLDRTNTDSVTVGASLQATSDARLFDHGNRFAIGGSIDHSWTNFTSSSTLAFINPDLSITTTNPEAFQASGRSFTRWATSDSSRSISTRRTIISACSPPTRSTSPRSYP